MSIRNRDVLFSFFMFTADLQPGNEEYARSIAAHMKELLEIGYDGFDLPIAPGATLDHAGEVDAYKKLRAWLDAAGLRQMHLTTNVGATRTFDPSSPFKEQREVALAYLKSRVDITKVLGASVMAGPIVLPYGVFPTTDGGTPIWSDNLQEWLVARYRNAMPVLEELAQYAAKCGVRVAIEPVDHWETPAPNLLSELLRFLVGVRSAQVGACIDSAHVVLGSEGPDAYEIGMEQLLDAGRLHYVHLSAPDRGAVLDSWIPWRPFLKPIFERYDGPYLVEVFNAIPVFLNSLRLTRRKFWIPGEDTRVATVPDAYTVASQALAEVRRQFESVSAGKEEKQVPASTRRS